MTVMARGGKVVGDTLWDGFTYLVMNGGRERTMKLRLHDRLITVRSLALAPARKSLPRCRRRRLGHRPDAAPAGLSGAGTPRNT